MVRRASQVGAAQGVPASMPASAPDEQTGTCPAVKPYLEGPTPRTPSPTVSQPILVPPLVQPNSLWRFETIRDALHASRVLERMVSVTDRSLRPRRKIPICDERETEYWFSGSNARWHRISIQNGHRLSCQELERALGLLKTLDAYGPHGVRAVRFGEKPSGCCHRNMIDVEYPVKGGIPLIDHMTAHLTHEIGHALYQRLEHHGMWSLISTLSLGWGRYHIIDESNYFAVEESAGHPFSNPAEAFASAVNVYFNCADKFASYLQHKSTPPHVRRFGELVWCFMREYVFRGRVFTRDGSDPCKREATARLLHEMKEERLPALLSAYRRKGDDPFRDGVRARARQELQWLGCENAEMGVQCSRWREVYLPLLLFLTGDRDVRAGKIVVGEVRRQIVRPLGRLLSQGDLAPRLPAQLLEYVTARAPQLLPALAERLRRRAADEKGAEQRMPWHRETRDTETATDERSENERCPRAPGKEGL
jgi:hypothetical protein